jgi:non-ribosomal peptide synthetase component F
MEFISQEEQVHFPGIEVLGGRERTNYPFALTVEDFGTALGLTVQTLRLMDPGRVSSFMRRAIESLVVALESTSDIAVLELDILPVEEHKMLVQELNSLTIEYPQHQTIHGLFEEQVERTPQATALVFMSQSLTYSELNERANRLAHQLISLGVWPDTRVAICVERSLSVVVGILAILKSGGAYVPLDPSHSADRLRDILVDVAPMIVIADDSGRAVLGEEALSSITVVDPNASDIIDLSR